MLSMTSTASLPTSYNSNSDKQSSGYKLVIMRSSHSMIHVQFSSFAPPAKAWMHTFESIGWQECTVQE